MSRPAKNKNVAESEKLEIKGLYKEPKKELTKLIRHSRRKHWEKLCKELDEDIWGEGYKIATRGLRRIAPYNVPLDTKKAIIRSLFHERMNAQQHQHKKERVSTFTADELTAAASNMKSGRAPGVDGIPPEAIKLIVDSQTTWLLNVMNSLFEAHMFPNEWKVAKVTLLLKKGKSSDNPASYRPLCLLNTISR